MFYINDKTTGKKKKIFSINEKIKYYTKLSQTGSKLEKQLANIKLQKLNDLKDINKSFGEVFITQDKKFNLNASCNKTRRIVLTDVKNGNPEVIPVYKNKRIVFLSGFDKKRVLNTNNKFLLSFDDIYEKTELNNILNDYLTSDEKLDLKSKL